MTALLAFFAGPLGRWIAIGLMLLAMGAACFYKGDQHRGRVDAVDLQKLRNDWDAQRAAQAKAVKQQKDSNLSLQRAAEKKYVVVQEAQTKFFTNTTKEIHDAAAPLATCPVPEPVRVRLNAAAACARGDSPGSCSAGDHVPDAK